MSPDLISTICLILGVGLLALATWERLGRGPNARAWTDAATEARVRSSLFVLPGIGMLALLLGVAPWMQDVPALGFLALLAGPIGLWLVFGWGFLTIPYPRWSVPAWARTKVATRFEKEKWLR